MKINKTLIIILTVLTALILVRIFFFGNEEPSVGRSGGGPGKGGAPAVSGVLATGSSLDEVIHASGSVMANEEVVLTTEIPGRITLLNFKEGSHVNKGDLLVKLNDNDLLAQMRKQESSMQLLQEKNTRQKKLLEINGISKEEYDELTTQIQTLKADLDFTRAQIAKTEIRAPFSGKIGLRYLSEGATVTVTDKIATLQQIDPVKIDFSIPEKYAGEVVTGDEIRFTVSGNRDDFTGKIYATDSRIDPATRTFRLRAICPNHEGKIFPGSFANIELVLKQDSSALMIPTQAIIPVLKGKKVMIAKNGKAISHMITTGIRTDKMVEVLSGIDPGDTIITTGLMQLRDSMDVKVNLSTTEN